MVKVKEAMPVREDGSIDVEQWLYLIGKKGYVNDLGLIRKACTLSQLASLDHAIETGESCLQQGLAMADVLADLEVDQDTLAAAIIFVSVHYAELSLDDVEEQLGATIAGLVSGVEKMTAIAHVSGAHKTTLPKTQLDNIRKMLLAMVDDVRVVLIKLAERLCLLRTQAPISAVLRQHIAAEAMDIYAPLANRLGIGAIKWEMEDLAFRSLNKEEYTSIAKGLNAKRLERDHYVLAVTEVLNKHLTAMGIQHFKVYGRAKHIHSIYRKMQRKNVPLQEIYDATAVRILVDSTTQCYEILGLIDSLWKQVPEEFDDYISHPKQNGYQSLHTAVADVDGRIFEVQIRTFEMHEQAEMGVAAHWKYKEGPVQFKANYERKIEWLREVLAWHRDVSSKKNPSSHIDQTFIDDRVYVFTPNGDVLDLPKGVTALDFAYHLHSQIGHRCRGAKVNDSIVALTYQLKTGDRVEVLTGKEAKPSRDWINPHLNYLKTSRAKAKVLHWFNQQSHDKNRIDGQEITERLLKTLGMKTEQAANLLSLFKFKNLDEFYIAMGRGDLKPMQILKRLSADRIEPTVLKYCKPINKSKTLYVEGVGKLLTTMARCCQPVPGDPVIGYITLGRGVSIHRKDCQNIIHSIAKQQQRFVTVSWGEQLDNYYPVEIIIKAVDSPTVLRDVTSLLAMEKTHVFALKTQNSREDQITYISVTIETDGLLHLSQLLDQIKHLPQVIEARRHV